MIRTIQTLGIVVIGSALSSAALWANTAQAAIITYSFDVNVTSGPLSGNKYGGSFSYDNASPDGAGDLLLPYFEATDFKFEFSDQTYTLQDLRYECRPGPAFRGCVPIATEFEGTKIITDESGGIALVPGDAEVTDFRFANFRSMPPYEPGNYFSVGPGEEGFFYGTNSGGPPIGEGDVSYAVVPELTSSLVASVIALGFGTFLQKKRVQSQKPGR